MVLNRLIQIPAHTEPLLYSISALVRGHSDEKEMMGCLDMVLNRLIQIPAYTEPLLYSISALVRGHSDEERDGGVFRHGTKHSKQVNSNTCLY